MQEPMQENINTEQLSDRQSLDRIKADLAREYGLHQITHIEPYRGINGSNGQFGPGQIFKVTSSAGVYALKLQSENKREKQFLLEARLQHWMRLEGFLLVPHVVLSRLGHPYATTAGRRCMLTDFLPHASSFDWRQGNWGVDDCFVAGQALAQLHSFLAKLNKQEIEAWGYELDDAPPSLATENRIGVGSVRPYIASWFNRTIDRVLSLEADRLISPRQNELDHPSYISDILRTKILAVREPWLKLLQDSEAELEMIPAAKHSSLIHGDFHPGNVLWCNGRIKAFLDFEHAHFEHPVYDVAYGLIMFCGQWQLAKPAPNDLLEQRDWKIAENQNSPESIPLARAQKFLAGYINSTEMVDRAECSRLLKPFLPIAASVIFYWMLIEQSAHGGYENLIEDLADNLNNLSLLAGV